MKINLRKIAAAIVSTAKENPALVVAVATAVAPKVVAKYAPKVVPIIVAAAGKK